MLVVRSWALQVVVDFGAVELERRHIVLISDSSVVSVEKRFAGAVSGPSPLAVFSTVHGRKSSRKCGLVGC